MVSSCMTRERAKESFIGGMVEYTMGSGRMGSSMGGGSLQIRVVRRE